ncbi:MAG: substrate-binding domain-containing protein [Candidatus Hydrogenedentes bacterium]|nr:substrate-binding domain-containing protein [Candidatus Hydrogenedentota bacterium]
MANNHKTTASPAVRALAEKIVEDIRLRRTMPGDRYLTCEEARHLFGVGKGVMDRALRLLSDRRVLVRRRRSGTFVGPAAPVAGGAEVRTFCVLQSENSRELSDFPFDLMIKGLRREVPGANVQFNFVSEKGGVEYVGRLIAAFKATGHVDGIVSIGCPREVNCRLVDSGLPLVAFGSFYGGGRSTPWVDLDREAAGRLLTEYLLGRGHRRIALFTVATGAPGANDFFDGVSQALTAGRLPHNALVHRIIPPDIDVVAELADELARLPDRPTAFILVSERLAHAVAASVSGMGLAVPQVVEVVFWDHATFRVRQSPYPHVQPKLPVEDIAAKIGRMLSDLVEGRPLARERILVPVEFRQPAQEDRAGPA